MTAVAWDVVVVFAEGLLFPKHLETLGWGIMN